MCVQRESKKTDTSRHILNRVVHSFALGQDSRLCHAAHAQKLQRAFLRSSEANLSSGAPFGAVVAAVKTIVYVPHLQLLPCSGSGSIFWSRRISGKSDSSACAPSG